MTRGMMPKDEHFMRQAVTLAKQALERGEFPVGCVLVAEGRVLAAGHRENSGGDLLNEVDHAEVLTLRRLLRQQPGVDCGNVTVYSTMEPCLMCYTTMLLSGIRRFVWAYEDVMGGGTGMDLRLLPPLYAQMQVELIPGVLRKESLALFQDFFTRYTYWRDSMLATYTLGQIC